MYLHPINSVIIIEITMTTYCTYVLHEKLLKTVVLNNIKLITVERETLVGENFGEFGGWPQIRQSLIYQLLLWKSFHFTIIQFCKQSIW